MMTEDNTLNLATLYQTAVITIGMIILHLHETGQMEQNEQDLHNIMDSLLTIIDRTEQNQ